MIKVLFEIYKVLGRIGIKPKDVIGMGGDIVKMGKSLFNTRINPNCKCREVKDEPEGLVVDETGECESCQ